MKNENIRLNARKSVIPCRPECSECCRQWWKLAEHLKLVVWLQDHEAAEALLKGLMRLLQWKWSLQLMFQHHRELLLYGLNPGEWQQRTHLQV